MGDPLRQPTTPRPAWVRLCQWLWDRRNFVWGTLIVGIIVGVSVNWLTSSTSIFTGTPLGAILLWLRDHLLLAGFIGLCLLFLTLFVGVVNYLADTPTRADLTSGQQRSRFAVIRFLRKEYHRQITESLGEVTKMALALQWRTDVTRSSVSMVSWRMDAPDDRSSSAPASIVQAYDDAGAGLLILGAPGAGKSTLLRELASELLQRAEDDTTQPVPVMVNLSSWALKRPPLTAWMVDRLWETYNIPPHSSQALIKQNQLLFLLDGLDEVESSARTKCIEAINDYLAEQEQIVLIVVCSRSHAYLEQEERLRLPIAVEIRPLTSEQVDSYLKSAGRPLAAVRTTLRSNAVLRKLVTTPLMLSVVTLAYRGKTVKDLPQLGSAEDQQRQVFDHYITRMLEQPARKWHCASSQRRKWLIWLAQQMKQQGLTVFFLESLEPTWLPTKRAQALHPWLSMLLIALFGGLLIALLIALFGGLYPGPLGRLLFALLSGLFGGLFGGPLGELLGELLGGLFIALLGGLLGGLLIALGIDLTRRQLAKGMRLKPNQGIHNAGWNALPVGLFGGLLLGLLGGLLLGLLGGLLLALTAGGAFFLNHYRIRFLLWRSGVIPWRYVRFLEEATEHILLQRVGGGYLFIHPLFQEYFATLGTETSADT